MPDPLRFQKEYGVPPGRSAIAKKPLDYLYRVEEVLDSGCGANAIGGLNNGVFLVRHVKSGKHRVQKCIPAHTSMPDSSMLEREILLLEVLRHPNVVGFVDACITDTVPRQMSLYMEYCDLGSLQKMIKRYTNHNANRLATPGRQQQQQQPPTCFSVPEAFVWHVLHSLASALQYLHHGIAGNDRREPPEPKDLTEWPPILHRDIKPDNILLRTAPGVLSLYKDTSQPSVYPHWPFNNEDPEGGDRTYPKIVLADFGIATQYHEPDFHNPKGFIGTPQFSPPELPKTSSRGDVWALGASVLSLCRLLPDGPVCGPPAHYPNRRQWYMEPECRREVAHIGPGGGYSGELELVLRASLRFYKEDRVSSWQLMREVRKGEETMLSSEGWGLKVRPLPGWAYSG